MNSRTSLSALTFLIVLAIIVVVNYIVGGIGVFNPRFDLTEKGIYTLSDGTKRILSGLNPEKPVTIRLYITQDNRLMPQWAQAYATTVRDLLLEFEKNSDGKVHLDKIDPRPNTEDEDKAVADDIQGYTVNENGDKAYFGVAIESLKQKEVLPSLNPNEEANLEYQLARAIAKVSTTKRQVVGVMSPMPIAAAAFNFPGMPQKQPPPWVVIQQLRQDYDVREVPISSDKIDDDVNVLLIIHPYGISGKAQFAIDQFLLKGGKVIAFVDPQCLVSKAYDQQGQPGMAPTRTTSPTSDLPGLFAAWGVKFDQGKVVADMTYRTRGGRGNAVPTFLTVDREGINREEPITSSLEIVQMFGSGSFAFDKKDGITYTTLVESSENSEMIDSTVAEEVQRNGLKTFNSGWEEEGAGGAAVRQIQDGLSRWTSEGGSARRSSDAAGRLPGMPPGFSLPGAPGESGGEDKKDAGAPVAAKDAKKDAAPAAPPSLKEGDGKGVVFLFADADMEYDMFALQSDAKRPRDARGDQLEHPAAAQHGRIAHRWFGPYRRPQPRGDEATLHEDAGAAGQRGGQVPPARGAEAAGDAEGRGGDRQERRRDAGWQRHRHHPRESGGTEGPARQADRHPEGHPQLPEGTEQRKGSPRDGHDMAEHSHHTAAARRLRRGPRRAPQLTACRPLSFDPGRFNIP